MPDYIISGSAVSTGSFAKVEVTQKIGIGTVAPGSRLDVVTTSNSDYPLLVRGDIDNDGGYTGIHFSYNGSSGAASYRKAAIHVEGTSGNVQPDMHFLLNSQAGTLNTQGLTDAKLTILNGGNVGIGDTTPSYKLAVAGTGHFTGNLETAGQLTATTIESFNGSAMRVKRNDGTNTRLEISNTHTGDAFLLLDASNGDFGGADYATISHQNSTLDLIIGTESSAGKIRLTSKGSNTMALDGANVTIASTAAPNNSAKLGVAGNINVGNGQASSIVYFENSGTDMYVEGNANKLNIGSVGNTQAVTFPAGGGIHMNAGNVSGSAASTGSFGRLQASVLGGNSPIRIEADNLNIDSSGTVSGSSTSTGSFGSAHITNNVGIGTTSPSANLNIYDNNTDSYQAILEQDGTGDAALAFKLTGEKWWSVGIDNSDSNKFKIGDDNIISNSTRLTIDTSGNVGIGTATPGSMLEIWQGVGNGSSYDVIKIDGNTGNYGGMWIAGQWANGQQGRIGFYGTSTSAGDRGVGIVGDSGNTPHVFVNSGGSVGIGTTSPESTVKLHVYGGGITVDETGGTTNSAVLNLNADRGSADQDSGEIRFRNNSATSYTRLVGVRGSGDTYGGFQIRTRNSSGEGTRLAISEAGNVGIGSTNPYSALNVRGANGTNGNAKRLVAFFDTTSAAAGTGAGIALGGYTNGTSGDINDFANIQGIKENGTAGNYASALTFQTRANGANTQEQMRISSTGNVGIGTTSPGQALHVKGGFQINHPSFATSYGLRLTLADSGNGGVISTFESQRNTSWTSTVQIGNGANSDNPSLRVRNGNAIFESNVGIGTTNPGTNLLQVFRADGTNSGDYTMQIYNADTTSDQGHGLLIRAGNDANDIPLQVRSRTNTTFLKVDGSGKVGIGTSSPTAKLHIYQVGDATNNEIIMEADSASGGNTGNQYITLIREDTNRGNEIRFKTHAHGGSAVHKFSLGQTDSDEPGVDGTEFYIGRSSLGANPDFTISSGGDVGIGCVANSGIKLRIEDTNATMRLQASNNGGSVEMLLYPDQAADNADLRRIVVADGGGMTFESYRTGGFLSDLTLDGATGNVTIAKNLTVGGTITAEKIISNVVSQSISFATGSNIFGDSTADTHQMTGSMTISGSLKVNGTTISGGGGGSSVWSTNGNKIYYNSANVGIGTTNPGKKFVVETTTDYDGIEVRDVNAVARIANGSADDGYIQLLKANVGKVQIHSSGATYFTGGSVGIGVTSPDAKLHVYNGDSSVTPTTSADDFFIESGGHTGMTIGSGASSHGNIYFGDSGDVARGIIRYDHSADTMGFGVNGSSQHMMIKSGNVGIGTTNPDNTLHVHKGTAGTIAGTAQTPLVVENNNHNFIQFLNPANKQAGLYFGSPGNNYYDGTIAYDKPNDQFAFEIDAASGNNKVLQVGTTYISSSADVTGSFGQMRTGPQIITNNVAGNTALTIDNNTEGYAIVSNAKWGPNFTQDSADGRGLEVSRNNNDAESHPLVSFTSNHTADTKSVLHIKNDGSGAGISYAGSGHVISGSSTSTGSFGSAHIADKVGIGTATPDGHKLHVHGNSIVGDASVSNSTSFMEIRGYGVVGKLKAHGHGVSTSGATIADSIMLEAESSAAQGLVLATAHSTAPMRFFTNGGERIRILSGGNVGIGPSTPNAGTLVVSHATDSSVVIQSATDGGSDASLWFKVASGTADENKKAGIVFRDTGTNGIGDLYFLNDSATDGANATVAANTAMVIKSAGNVGIGTTTPDDKLEIYGGDLKITSTEPQITWERTSGAIKSFLTCDVGSFQFSYNSEDGDGYVDINVNGSGASSITHEGNGNLVLGANGHTQLTLNANGTSTFDDDVSITGKLSATSKSFLINHPTKEGKKLQYASLEGPENGVYVRGKIEGNVIYLPDYWVGLVHDDSITVNLTPVGKYQQLYVEDIKDNQVFIKSADDSEIKCFYTIYGERKDIEKLEVEF